MENKEIDVLVLEDNLSQAQTMRGMLAQSRNPVFSVRQVRTLAEGLDLLESCGFDVIIVALDLPDSSGITTALAVRNKARQACIIAIAGEDDEEAALMAVPSDIQAYLIREELAANHLLRSVRCALQRQRFAEDQWLCDHAFSSFLHNLPVAAWIKDLRGRYVHCNAEHERLLSMSFSGYAGKTDEEFQPLETARRLRDNDAQVAATGEPMQTIEAMRLAEGIDRHFLVSKFPVVGQDGKVTYVAGIALDVTEHVKAVEALRLSEFRFATVFHEAPALLAISSVTEGRYLDVNETALRTLGYQREEVIGKTALELNLWEDLSDRTAVLDALGRENSAKNIEVRLRGKGGEILICLFSAEYIEVDGERYMLSLVKDITPIKQAQEQIERLNVELAARAADLEDANRELEAFNYTVAHDLRNPLNIVYGYCQIMQKACVHSLEERCGTYLRLMSNAVSRMNRLITALLNFSRTARSQLHRTSFDLSAMAEAATAELKQSEPERQVEFRIAAGIVADGDPDLLRVVLNNLFGNAWKYTAMKEEVVIEFGATELDGRAAYFVRDNGPGFDKADAERLFIPFQRLDATVELKGFGIGLATVERIIRRHGGRIWAEGEAGKGATFWFTLAE